MARSLPVLAGTFAIAAAQSTSVISFMVPDWDGLHLSASVVDVKDDATTLAVRCEGVHLDWNMCGSNPQTIIGGPSTLSVSWVDPSAHLYDDVFYTKSQDLHCDIYLDQSTATCTSTAIDVIKGRRTTHVTTETTSRPDLYYYEVIATAGIEKLDGKHNDDSSTAIPAATTTSQPQSTDVETSELETSSKASATSEQVVVTDVATTSEARTNTTYHPISTPGSGTNPTSPIIVDNAAGARLVQNIVALGLAAGVCGAAMLL
ncbi:GPI anchored [Fusarium albosuccineum]|uniref:GPI anchored n=1 Tax=Fusarium albosuccineum TaxID=1237068 RepID=A0A8H4KXV4_9HYPO|nr:GPI anchored [Fusarium albosuccineum]